MTARPESLRVARRWIAKAAVEKLPKALLVFAGTPFARTHEVIQLVQMLPGHLGLSVPLADLAPLNR